MTIESVTVMSMARARDFYELNKSSKMERCLLIGVAAMGGSPFGRFKFRGSPTLGVVVEESFGDVKRGDPDFISEDAADRIVQAIMKANDSADPWQVFVHCSAGVSRSGAIGEFARTLAQLDYDMYKRTNPQVVPNTCVLRALHEAYEHASV